jgi:glycosyltransferase involved in cell wall biosynthesis
MKILQITPAFYPAISIGGPIFSTCALVSYLHSKGHYVDVITTPLGLTLKQKSSIAYGEALEIPNFYGIKFSGTLTYFRFYFYRHFTFSPKLFFWLLFNIHRYEFVFIHGVWNFPILAGSFLSYINKVPYVIYPHGTLYRETIELRSSFVKKLFLFFFVKRLLKLARAVIFTTQDEYRKVTKYLKSQFEGKVIPNIVPSLEFENEINTGTFRSLFNIPSDSIILLHYGRISKK